MIIMLFIVLNFEEPSANSTYRFAKFAKRTEKTGNKMKEYVHIVNLIYIAHWQAMKT